MNEETPLCEDTAPYGTKSQKEEIIEFIEPNIQAFHKRRLDNLTDLQLKKILSEKIHIYFALKLKHRPLLETILMPIFPHKKKAFSAVFLQELAIFICGKVYSGKKSSSEGIDLEFTKGGTTYIVSIKSGTVSGNSRQIARMKDDFKRRAKRILGTNTSKQRLDQWLLLWQR